MLQSNSFKTYSYSISYLALIIIFGYMTIKNLSDDSYLFESFILVIVIIAFIKIEKFENVEAAPLTIKNAESKKISKLIERIE